MTYTDPIPSSVPFEENSQNLEAVSQFIASIGRFAEVLQTHDQPTREERCMEFLPLSYADFLYPDRVRDWLIQRELTAIHVTTTSEDGVLTATTCEFSAAKSDLDDSDSALHVSRHNKQPTDQLDIVPIDTTGAYDSILYSNGRCVSTGTRISNRELNTFLLALCGKQRLADVPLPDTAPSSIDYPPYEPPLVTEQLSESLQQNAFGSTTDRLFELPSGRTVQMCSETVAGQSKLTSFTIYYETGSERRLRAELTLTDGLTVNFATCDTSNAKFADVIGELPLVKKLYPDEGDYIRLAEILLEEMASLSPQTIPVDPTILATDYDR